MESVTDDSWPEDLSIICTLKNDTQNGRILAVCENSDEQRYLVKCIFKDCGTEEEPLEVRILSTIKATGIISVFEIFQTPLYYCIQMELPEMHIHDYLSSNKKISECAARILAHDIIQGLLNLHEHGFCHGNINLETIALTAADINNAQSKLYDFDYAFEPNEEKNRFEKDVGHFTAPEEFDGEKIDEKIDIYSFGIVIYTMLTGQTPFLGLSDFSLVLSIKLGNIKFNSSDWNFLSTDAVDLVQSMIATDPSLRPTAAQCLEYDWIAGLEEENASSPETAPQMISKESLTSISYEPEYDYTCEMYATGCSYF